MLIRVIIPCASLGNLFLKKQLFQVLITYKTNLRVPEHITANKHISYKTHSEAEAHHISLWYIRNISGYI